ncbi:MAG: hypothetical protein PHO91_01250 [Patescibacteria group bacterium]|nr:hypothetical protein [Patescibacteria group bacterium]
MSKINWINFLHIYQPPWQDKGVIEQVAIESYDYLLSLFERYPDFRATLNITGNLIQQLELIRPDLLKRIKILVKKGQLELTASAKYHAFLPLLDKAEAKRQIKLNQEVLSQNFDLAKIKGFFLPEMAYSPTVAKIIRQAGFEWIILDSICVRGKVEKNRVYRDKSSGLKVLFRDRQLSKAYPPEVIFNKFKKIKTEETVISATDGEVYGHFHKDWQGHLEKILQNSNLVVKTVSQHLSAYKQLKNISLRPASWESSQAEIERGVPFALWQDPKNKIHRSLWDLVAYASRLLVKYRKDKNWIWARRHLDRGLSSCTFWWASAKRPSAFSPLTWNPDMIDNGSEELIKSVRTLKGATSAEKIKAEKIYIEIKKNTWLSHWRKYNK